MMIEKVNKAISSFIRTTGKRPGRLYLGQEDLMALLREIEQLGANTYDSPAKDFKQSGYRKLAGMTVYEVREDQHFNITE